MAFRTATWVEPLTKALAFELIEGEREKATSALSTKATAFRIAAIFFGPP